MPSLTQRVMAELRADKKKAAILALLALVALFLGGRLIFKSAGPSELGPAAAEGSPPGAQAGAGSSAPGLAPLKKPDVPADRPLKWNHERPTDGSVLRDLFVGDLRSYVRIEPDSVKKPDSPGQAPVPDMVEIEKAVRAQAKALTLQSTMIGPNSSAVINGQVLRVGQHIAGFRIVGIHPRSCDVEKKGVEVRLAMKK